jgi:putative membrane protein
MAEVRQEKVLWDAKFNPKVRTYWLLAGALILALTVVGNLLLFPWFIIGHWITGRYLRRMKCVLTETKLEVRKGILTRVEKTIPLDKITDVIIKQGPIMRHLDLEALAVETAGQSSQGALVHLAGVVDARRFRDAVLKQRDEVISAMNAEAPQATTAATSSNPPGDVLNDIRDTLHRIERQLAAKDNT